MFDPKAFAESLDMESVLSGYVSKGGWVTLILPIGREKLKGYPPPLPPPMDHQAIESRYWGKAASEVYYCSDGSWKVIGGAD